MPTKRADKKTRKSISGQLVIVGGMPIAWQVKQQTAVALSTAEAEFVAAAAGAKELLVIWNLLEEVGVQVVFPMNMSIDNLAAIKQFGNETTFSVQNHLDVQIKFVRDTAEKGIVYARYIATEDTLVDGLTKSLSEPRVLKMREKMGLM